MLDFAEQTGSGIVIMVWSFLEVRQFTRYLNVPLVHFLHVVLLNINQVYRYRYRYLLVPVLYIS